MVAVKSRESSAVGASPTRQLAIARFAPEQTYKYKVFAALKQAITSLDIYGSSGPTWLDERQLSEMLGVSRTPVREALAMLELEGFVKSVPRRGVLVVKKTKREMIDMIHAWAGLESMATRMITRYATDEDIASLRALFSSFHSDHPPGEHVKEYSAINIQFHQALIRLAGSAVMEDLTTNVMLHVRGIRQLTIGRHNRASQSICEHYAIIEALERRDADRAERLSREHTLSLATYIEEHEDLLN